MTTTPKPDSPQLPVGWHPDPWTDGDLYRYWDGSTWTAQTKPAPRKSKEPRKRRSVVFPLTFAAFLLVAVVTAVMMTRGDACKVSIGPATVDFFACQDVEARQSQMQQEVNSAKENAQAQAVGQPTSTVNLTGQWTPTQGGFSWQIEQYGNQVVVREVTPYGITAVAQGTLAGTVANLTYQAVDGSSGSNVLQLVDNRTLRGTVRSYATNAESTIELHR
ncbi:uncharacterized protein DUF2510 [Kribbella voronezhensis]|uniref:Uncharacterized protein DUF2510 n=1 Tax=Kribbella voronezhensis TaxID=2512212 RepID=A0A4R7THY9_9ACTN|nr:DUF2510 domain-containing protein [Kribbella voronezhensis]TDU91256.1 uncharacterized protein DUF2510 [Kribbella voronezhensis]